MKNKFSLGVSLCAGLAVIGGALTPAAYAQESQGNAAATCQNPGVKIVDGTLDWGIKESFRNYINGRIAHGFWTAEGAIKQDSDDKQVQRQKGFQFHFDVDPEASKIELDNTGNVVTSEIRTKDSTLTFEGHNGALYTQMKSPYIKTDGQKLQAGTTYVGYHVPGKNMTQYTKEDRTDENKRTGEAEFAAGTTDGWKLADNKLTMSGSNLHYVQNPNSDVNAGKLEGVDLIFQGAYDNSSPIDDVQINLNVEKTCLDPVGDTTKPGGAAEDSAPDQTNEQGAQQENTKPQEDNKPQGEATPPAAPKKPEIKQPENKQPEKKPEAEKQPPAAKQPGDKTNPGKTNPSKEEGTPKAPGSSLGKDFSSNAAESKGLNKFQQAFNVALGLVTFAGMATMIGNLFHKAFGPQVQHFLNNLPFKF
ncbi:HtaA domain-containing protein [Corynebacterium propinquum]|uniref:HtaA domain-containing protein n=1 Tax=Corynebacterium propinquum TaxID=43769 RepID=UPI00191E51CC|nr:HtaA domain-containing protein [Corynebacterium propinquum]QQU86187.1 HtaA domain-containing protein [Corynebacterium propinquum]